MTTKQKLLKVFYKLRMMVSGKTGMGQSIEENKQQIKPPVSFYGLQATLNNGQSFSFDHLKGKYTLLVNTASNCGYTGQYEDLESLYKKFPDKLQILGFPSNDFAGQEPDDDQSIASFCQINYGVSFPLFKKDAVKGAGAQPVFKWLSEKTNNGWNSAEPSWNFNKYLVNEEGVLLKVFSSAVSPLSTEIMKELK